MNKFLLLLLSLYIISCSSPTLARSKNFTEFMSEKINDKETLLKIWGEPSVKMNFNLVDKKYLYLRYTDKNHYPLADFTIDPKNNSVVEHLYYPQKNVDENIFNIFIEKHFKNINFNKVLDSCSHHDQFIHYNKVKGIFIFSHKLLNNERLINVVGYSKPEIIEKRLLENKTKKCGVNIKKNGRG